MTGVRRPFLIPHDYSLRNWQIAGLRGMLKEAGFEDFSKGLEHAEVDKKGYHTVVCNHLAFTLRPEDTRLFMFRYTLEFVTFAYYERGSDVLVLEMAMNNVGRSLGCIRKVISPFMLRKIISDRTNYFNVILERMRADFLKGHF